MKEIIEYRLNNDLLDVTILNIGASIKHIYYKNIDRVLNYNNNNDYTDNPMFLGSLIGPIAGRVEGASFVINGRKYQLEKNEGNNNLHGGSIGLHCKYWELVDYVNDKNVQRLRLKTNTTKGEIAYPGNIIYEIEYTLEGSKLQLDYYAHSDKNTFVNMTNHVYLNLNQNKEKGISNHSIKIPSDYFYVLDKSSIPKALIENRNTIFDLNELTLLSDIDFNSHPQTSKLNGFDHPFKLNGKKSILACHDEGVFVEIVTNYSTMIVYTGVNMEDGRELNDGVLSKKYQGICLEAQEEVNYMNGKDKLYKLLKANENYSKSISWTFKEI